MPRVITPLIIADFRRRLCDVASELLAEQGMDGFNMRELAKRLRVSPMTAYRYFKDKDEILGHLRARGFARLADAIEHAQAQSPEAGTALVRTYLRFAAEEPVAYRLMFDLFQPANADVPELARHQRRVRDAMCDLAAMLVQEGQLSGEPYVLGQVLWSTLHGIAALRLTAQLDEAAFEQVVTDALRTFANLRLDTQAAGSNAWQSCETDTPPAVLSAAQ
jgi:AcrR family transcriptional regulator